MSDGEPTLWIHPLEDECPDGYVEPVGGGWDGYQARCWGCDWRGPLRERKDDARLDVPEHDPSYGPRRCGRWARLLSGGGRSNEVCANG